jgi:hypothetical protein
MAALIAVTIPKSPPPAGVRSNHDAMHYTDRGSAGAAFAQEAESTFARYRDAGAREATVLVTLDAPNNFPQLPVRTDGPYFVWLGIVENESSLKSFTHLLESAQQPLSRTDLLRAAPEIVVLDPTKRSRLRWITEQ